MLNYWHKFPLEHIANFNKGTSGYSMLDAVISEWLSDFAYKSSSEKLHYQVKNIYSTFSQAGYQVGISMVKIMLDKMFFT